MEQKQQTKIIEFLRKKLGAFVIKSIVTAQGGVPDIIACFRGVYIAIECKDIGKKTKGKYGGTPLQDEKIQCILDAGGIAFVAETLDEVQTKLWNALKTKGIDPNPLI